MSDQIAHKVSVAITVEWILKQAGALQTGKSGTTTATVFDEVDGSFSTPTVTEPITGIYRCSFTPDTAGLWHVKIVETSLPEAIVMSYRVVAVVDSEELDDIQARLPAALVSGRMDSSVGAMAANVLTATAIATDAITAAKIAADAIGASELAADAVAEIQSGLATSAALANVQSDTDDIQTRLPATLVGGRMRSHVEAMDAGVITAAVIATDAVDADALAANAVAEIQSGLATSAALANVQADTDDIQSRLPAALVGGRMDSSVGAMAANVITSAATDATFIAEINAEVDAALVDIRLDELIQNAAAPADPTADSFIDLITSKDAAQTFDRAMDSLEAIRDSAAGAGLTAQQVRDAMKLAPSVGAPAAGSVDEHLDDILADTAAMQPLIDVATSTRAAPGDAMDLITDAVDANSVAASGVAEIQAGLATAAALATVQADTDDIQTRLPATLSGGRMRSQVEGIDANAITAASMAADASQEITNDVLDELIAGHLGAGSVGEAINNAAAGGAGLTQQQVADALKLAPAAGAPAAGSVYSEFDVLMGPGFNPATDSNEEIRDRVDECCGVSGGGDDDINVEGI